MQAGDIVVHPQWGQGTVLFDKEHCIGVRFLEHGQVNFSQEEWQQQKSPLERFRGVASSGSGSESELEYALHSAVENGDLSEDRALAMLAGKVHPMEVRRHRRPDLNDTYRIFLAYPEDSALENQFYQALLSYIKAIVGQHSFNRAAYSNVEDAIQDSALEVWQGLPQFDASKSSLKSWVRLITIRNVRDLFRKYRSGRGHRSQPADGEGHPDRFILVEAEDTPAVGLPADKQLLLKEFLSEVAPQDRTLLQMLMDGLTQSEMAEALNVSQQAISKRLNRLRRVVKRPF